MSKFVTYPAVTVLDNDHSLLIDSPNAGTNSITANNAADTLLSKWSGFDTFDEAVQNTISNNQEFIDRDAAIRSETADLKRKIVTTFPAKDASGQIATFESEFEDAPLKSCIVQVNPVQDLHGYDHPWPAGGGKNKLLFITVDATSSRDGVEVSYNAATEVITVTGTETHGSAFSVLSSYKYRLPKFVAGETYTISRTQVTGNLDKNIYFQITYRSLNGQSTALVLNRTASTTFTVPNNFDVVTNTFVGVFAGVSNVNNAFKLQLELGSTATAYEPYSNECPISGFTGCEIVRANANLWNDDWYTLGNVMTLITDETNDFYGYYNGSVKRWESAQAENGNEHLFPNGVDRLTVTFEAGCVNTNYGFTFKVFFHYTDGTTDSAGGNATLDSREKKTFVRASTIGKKCTGFLISTIAGTGNYGGAVRRIMVGANDERDIIAPIRTTYPIIFPSEAGTVYGGYVDVINGELVVEYVRKRVNSDLGSVNFSTSRVRYTVSDAMPMNSETSINDANIMCSHFPKVSTSSKAGVRYSYSDNYAVAFILFQGLDTFGIENTLEGWNAFLESHEVYVTYKLAEPIHYPLTPTEVKTLLGTNNIWADTGDVSVEYLMSDVGWYVEKKLRAFQSVLAGVEDSAVASKNYSTDSYLIFNDDIYRVTKTITAGETIEEGVNVTKTTVAEQLMALAQA